MLDLAEVEDEATGEDGREAEKRVAMISIHGFEWEELG